MPTLHWIVKDKVINHHMDVSFKVLEYSCGFDNGTQTEKETNRGNYGQALYIDNINISSAAGLNESEIANQNISVYPNPTSGIFSLSISNSTKNLSTYQVMNNFGQVILKNKIDTKQNLFNQNIDLSKYGKGIYLLSVIDIVGKVVKNVKVVVY